jgi:hypothetical protein
VCGLVSTLNLVEFYTRKAYENELKHAGVDACEEYLNKKVYVQTLTRMITDIEHPKTSDVLFHQIYPEDVKQWATQTLIMHVVPISEDIEMERLLKHVVSLRDQLNEREEAVMRLQKSVNDLTMYVTGIVHPKPTQ